MFWGIKLECGRQYSQLVERSFHISQAVLQVTNNIISAKFRHALFEVHAIVEKTDYILCYLGAGGWTSRGENLPSPSAIQQLLNLNISEGEEIILYVRQAGLADKQQDPSAGSVYLTGYFVEEPTFAPNLDELLADDEYTLDDASSDSDDNEGGDFEEGEEDDGDLDEQSLAKLLLGGPLRDSDSDDDDFVGELGGGDVLNEGSRSTRKRLAKPPLIKETKSGDEDQPANNSSPPNKRQCLSEKETQNEPRKPKTKKKNKAKGEESSSLERTEEASNGSSKSLAITSKKEKKLPAFKTQGGTEVQELKMGGGKVAKLGSKVFVKYTGRLAHNQKIFDSNITQKKAFMFRLGQGEVIRGWDEGLNGMRVGGKRKLLIPPKQGYGASGMPPSIPPNSRLLFDVELTDVK